MKDLLGQIQGLLTSECGPGIPSCLKFSDFSPTNFLAPFKLAQTSAEGVVNEASRALELQDSLIANQAAAVQKAAEEVSKLDKIVSDLSTQRDQLLLQITNAKIQLDQIPTPGGHIVVPSKEVCVPLIGCHDIPFAPPIWVPDFANPLLDQLRNTINSLQAQVNDIANKLIGVNNQLQEARRDLTYKSSIEALQGVQRKLQEELRKARGALEFVIGVGLIAQAMVDNLIPCTGRIPGH